MENSEVLIIGAGPVGLFAAFKAGMVGMKSNIVDILDSAGGQCSALYPEKPIYDIPAYPKILAGELIERLKEQNSIFSPKYFLGQQIRTVKRGEDGYFVSITDKGVQFRSKIIIIAAGAGAFAPNKPPIANIELFENQSVFYHVDNVNKFQGKKIVIAGGGDSAIDWAINLSNIAQKIYLIHRRDKFRASPSTTELVHMLEREGKIEIIKPYQLHSLEGKDGILSKVNVVDFDNNLKPIEADILLPFFGLSSQIGPIKNWGLNIDKNTILVNQATQMTNIEGIYAVGDVCEYEGKLKLILTGFSECAHAVHHAYPFVFGGNQLHFQHSTSMDLVS
ncbi:MAG: NAD(P)/FAD-dependent oxidoreductase [Rickettsiaceae bacterium]|nr:NAD(P)/FAD-dependent oxidoreductase [Rickettsiaceae bacterium]